MAVVSAAMSAVQEQVEERTQQHQQKRENAQDVGPVLSDKEECSNRKEDEQH
jgi:hypothetical protein